MRDGGKGDAPRPLGVPKEVFDRNFDAIFGIKPQNGCKGDCEQGKNPCNCDKEKEFVTIED